MPKTQMQLANRAWRIETKALGWHRGWKKGRKQWKDLCQRNDSKCTYKNNSKHFT